MPRRLVWGYEALAELADLLKRRAAPGAVQNCISDHARLVAEELNIATAISGPSQFRSYVFTCSDVDPESGGMRSIHIRLIFDAESEDELVVIICKSVAL